MAACTGADRNETVHALVDRLLRVADVDDVVQHHAAVRMRGLDDFLRRPQRGDDDRHFVLRADGVVMRQAVVGDVADLVDGEGRGSLSGLLLPRRKFGLDAQDPFLEHRLRAGVQRGERAHNPGLALRDDELRPRHDEKRRADDGKAQAAFEHPGKRHGMSFRDSGCDNSSRRRAGRQAEGLRRIARDAKTPP